MVRHKPLSETIGEELRRDVQFRRLFLGEIINDMIAGNTEGCKLMLAEYVQGTIGVVELAEVVHLAPAELQEALSLGGLLSQPLLFAVIAHLQKVEGAKFTATLDEAA